MLETLQSKHLHDVMHIVGQVIDAMRSRGIEQWDDLYPDPDTIARDLIEGKAWGHFEEQELIAYIVRDEQYDEQYDDINWHTTGRSLYVHRMMVSPSHQGKGIARRCMVAAEVYAREKGFDNIRLDAYAQNPSACGLYSSLKYKKVGEIFLRKGLFYCYEKNVI